MTKSQKKIIVVMSAFVLGFACIPNANAMHIMEGAISLKYCVIWGVVCLPFLVAGFFSIKNTIKEHRRTLVILAMAGAYAFVISSLKLPSVTGSSSHATGTGLGAILFGASVMSILGMLVLIFQAILLAHGGISTLGANTFSMAIAGPFVSFGIYKLCKLCKMNQKVGIFLAAALGDLFTYCVTSFQLALAHPSQTGGVLTSMVKFMGVFALTQVPLAIIEGLVTVVVLIGLESYAKTELTDLGYFMKKEDAYVK